VALHFLDVGENPLSTPNIIEPPKNEVTVKCAIFPPDEREEFEDFLRTQPGIEKVWRQRYMMDYAPDPDTLGLLIQPPWDIVVAVGNRVIEAAPAVATLGLLFLEHRKQRREQEKNQREQKAANTELIVIVDAYGKTVSIVEKPNGAKQE
jgi:hypothetical protein